MANGTCWQWSLVRCCWLMHTTYATAQTEVRVFTIAGRSQYNTRCHSMRQSTQHHGQASNSPALHWHYLDKEDDISSVAYSFRTICWVGVCGCGSSLAPSVKRYGKGQYNAVHSLGRTILKYSPYRYKYNNKTLSHPLSLRKLAFRRGGVPLRAKGTSVTT